MNNDRSQSPKERQNEHLELLAERIVDSLSKMTKTIMLKRFHLQFFVRLVIFIAVFAFYIKDKALFRQIILQPRIMDISIIHLLWVYFMVIMISHLIPREKLSMAMMKAYRSPQKKEEDYSELELMRFVRDQNVKAWLVMLVWLGLNGVLGVLYLFSLLDEADLLMATTFYFLSDYICILFFCPFQTLIMKNKCCINCRIYDWGHFMMFTPMLFIKNFFSWSLFFTSCVVLINWELKYAMHPERFWHGSSEKLRCENCNEQLCHFKKRRQLKSQLKSLTDEARKGEL
ncbi:MAG: hypothetical protein HUJ80_02850 [Firmicutes bacterium]|nr:hypothetical protein [Bacillota bacterium]